MPADRKQNMQASRNLLVASNLGGKIVKKLLTIYAKKTQFAKKSARFQGRCFREIESSSNRDKVKAEVACITSVSVRVLCALRF